MSEETDVEKLIEYIANGSEIDAFEAAKTFIALEPRGHTKRLVEILREGETTHNREAAAYVLTWLTTDLEALDALIIALHATDFPESVRGQAAEGIGEHKPSKNHKLRKKAESAILSALKDESPEVRFWACFAAGKLKLREALPVLNQIKDDDKSINPGWWHVSEEAEDAIEWIHGRPGQDRIPMIV